MLRVSRGMKSAGGSGCCSSGGARKPAKKPVRKYVKKGGNTGDSDETAETSAVDNKIEDLYTNNDSDDVQEGGAKKKKGSKVAAKKALSPYNKFVKKHFAILKKQFPDEKAPQIMQKVAIEWNKTKK